MVINGQTINSNDLLKRMWLTKGSRYNAYRRLLRKHDLSISSIAILSSYVLIINSLKFADFISLNEIQISIITFFSIVISIFILTLSLLDTSKDYKMNADKLYLSAVEIETLYNELEHVLTSTLSKKDKEKKEHHIASQYSKILQIYQVNHDKLDFDQLLSDNTGWQFNNFLKKNFIFLRTKILPYILYHSLIVATPILLVSAMVITVFPGR